MSSNLLDTLPIDSIKDYAKYRATANPEHFAWEVEEFVKAHRIVVDELNALKHQVETTASVPPASWIWPPTPEQAAQFKEWWETGVIRSDIQSRMGGCSPTMVHQWRQRLGLKRRRSGPQSKPYNPTEQETLITTMVLSRGMSLQEVAAASGCSKSFVYKTVLRAKEHEVGNDK